VEGQDTAGETHRAARIEPDKNPVTLVIRGKRLSLLDAGYQE